METILFEMTHTWSTLKQILNWHAKKVITDEMAERVLTPVCNKIKAGEFDRLQQTNPSRTKNSGSVSHNQKLAIMSIANATASGRLIIVVERV